MGWVSRWEYKRVSIYPSTSGEIKLDEALQELWEPYAVTWDGHIYVHHLRRLTPIKEKKQ